MSTTDAKSNYLEEKLIKAALTNTAFAGGATLYVALYTAAADGETDSLTEVTGGSYARQPITAATGWTDDGQVSGGYQLSNANEILFPVASANWGDVTHYAIRDALVAGNELYFCQCDTTKTINTNDQYRFPAGTLKVREK